MENAKKSVLLSENRSVYMAHLSNIVQRMGFGVETAASADSLLERAEKSRPDMLFLDMGLSGMDCMEVLKCIRDRDCAKGLPVVFVSDEPSEEVRNRCLELGAESYMMKPVGLFELHEVLQRCIYAPLGYMRAHMRVTFSQKVGVSHMGSEQWLDANTLSESGIDVFTRNPLPRGSDLEIRLRLSGNRPLPISGKVVYSTSVSVRDKGFSTMAVEFADKDLDKHIVISDVVAGLLMASPGTS